MKKNRHAVIIIGYTALGVNFYYKSAMLHNSMRAKLCNIEGINKLKGSHFPAYLFKSWSDMTHAMKERIYNEN